MVVTWPLPSTRFAIVTIILLSWGVPLVIAANFDQCLNDIQLGKFGLDGITDNDGHQLNITSTDELAHINVTSITYQLCLRACGAGQEPFSRTTFSKQFGAWLLPWLALISQLPFGGETQLTNVISMLLNVGSPALAAYSLAITVLNGKWVAQHFKRYKHPNARKAVRALSSLQQAPLEVREGLPLDSIITLRENNRWWADLEERISYPHTWSVSAAASVGWVVVAYVLTVIDSFAPDIAEQINANGQGVGSLWLWLLAIVIGWLQISPKCKSAQLLNALGRTNEGVFISNPGGRVVGAGEFHMAHPFYLRQDYGDILRHDEYCTPPIFNYARVLPWVETVGKFSRAFRRITGDEDASKEGDLSRQLNEGPDQEAEPDTPTLESGTITPTHRKQAPSHESNEFYGRWESGVMPRMLVASLFALCLQWGTTGAAITVVAYTPTRGLGCRSAAYILYGSLSTIIWMMMVLSAAMTHYATVCKARRKTDSMNGGRLKPNRWAGLIPITAIILRRVGKVLASLNALWIVASCLFQFSNLFNNCYCNSSVLGLGTRAYNVMVLDQSEITTIKHAWIGGVVLAATSTTIFVCFVNFFIQPPLPPK